MKINFDQRLMDLELNPLEWETNACPICRRGRTSKPATLKVLCADALVQGYTDARGQPIQIPGDEHVRRFKLAMKVMQGGELDISVEDVALIRDLVKLRFTPLFAGQIWLMIDPEKGATVNE